MAIANYADLQTAVANWMARVGDDQISDNVADFITLFEAEANRRLRVRQMETTATITPSSGTASLPSDYLAWRRVTWTGSLNVELEFVEPTWLRAAYPSSDEGTPKFFSVEGSSIHLRPVSDTDITLHYWEKIDALSDDATTNWLLTAHPDAYLFGALCEAHLFVRDAAEAEIWKVRRDAVFTAIERLDRTGRGPAAIRPMGVVV